MKVHLNSHQMKVQARVWWRVVERKRIARLVTAKKGVVVAERVVVVQTVVEEESELFGSLVFVEVVVVVVVVFVVVSIFREEGVAVAVVLARALRRSRIEEDHLVVGKRKRKELQ
jgi:hypothetical protein